MKKITLFLIVFFLLSPNAYSSYFTFNNTVHDKELCIDILRKGKLVETIPDGKFKINYYVYGKDLYRFYFDNSSVRCSLGNE